MRTLSVFILVLAFSVFALGQQSTGQPAHNFLETTITGESIEMDKLRGKVVVLTFWSTRCEICASEIPNLNRLVDKYGEKDVEFIGLAWQDKAKLEAFFQKKPFKFKIVPQSFGVLLKYADRDSQGRLNMGFPSYFIVSQDGTVVYKSSGFDKVNKIDSTISKLLSNNLAKVD